MVLNFVAGGAAINVLSRHVGARVMVTDVGVNADLGAAAGVRHARSAWAPPTWPTARR